MNTQKTNKYTAPTVGIFVLHLEQGIATSSASATPTGSTPYQPDVEDWRTETETQQFYL